MPNSCVLAVRTVPALFSGVMSFYDANGSLIASNNYLALLDGTATSATPLLVSFSVVGNGLGYVG